VGYKNTKTTPGPQPITVIGNDNGRILQADQLFQDSSLRIITEEKERDESEDFYHKSIPFRIGDTGSFESDHPARGEFLFQEFIRPAVGCNNHLIPQFNKFTDHGNTPGSMTDSPVKGTNKDFQNPNLPFFFTKIPNIKRAGS
jgi:hypothetical protein